MTSLAHILSLVVAAQHVLFFVLESFFWTKPIGMKVFKTKPEQAEATRTLAFNQGFYNAILAAGLFWAVSTGSTPNRLFFLGSVVVAGLVGGFSVSRSILFVQALPAVLAIAATLIAGTP
jgi:putative membrane protein